MKDIQKNTNERNFTIVISATGKERKKYDCGCVEENYTCNRHDYLNVCVYSVVGMEKV
jgi:hypothetical protein